MRLDHLLSRESPSGKHSHGSSSRFRGKGPALLASVSGDVPLQVHSVANANNEERNAYRYGVEEEVFLFYALRSTLYVSISSSIHERSFIREDRMSVGWMPRRCVPMKDVALLR